MVNHFRKAGLRAALVCKFEVGNSSRRSMLHHSFDANELEVLMPNFVSGAEVRLKIWCCMHLCIFMFAVDWVQVWGRHLRTVLDWMRCHCGGTCSCRTSISAVD